MTKMMEKLYSIFWKIAYVESFLQLLHKSNLIYVWFNRLFYYRFDHLDVKKSSKSQRVEIIAKIQNAVSAFALKMLKNSHSQ